MLAKQVDVVSESLLLLLLLLCTAELSAGCAPSPLTNLLGAAPALRPCEKVAVSAGVVPLSLVPPRVGLRRCRVLYRVSRSQCSLGFGEFGETLSYSDDKSTQGHTESMAVRSKTSPKERSLTWNAASSKEFQRRQSNESEKEKLNPTARSSRTKREGHGCNAEERISCNGRSDSAMVASHVRKSRIQQHATCDLLCSRPCDLELICKILKEVRACPPSCVQRNVFPEESAHVRRRRRSSDVAGAILTLALAGVVALVIVAVFAALLTAAVTAALVVAAWDSEHRPTPLPAPPPLPSPRQRRLM